MPIDLTRIELQQNTIRAGAGHAMTWRRLLSSGSANKVMGLGGSATYQNITITGLLDPVPEMPERAEAAGAIVDNRTRLSLSVKVGRDDLIVWGSATYRVEAEPVFEPITHQWRTTVLRTTV